jgi:hypothetical protein
VSVSTLTCDVWNFKSILLFFFKKSVFYSSALEQNVLVDLGTEANVGGALRWPLTSS